MPSPDAPETLRLFVAVPLPEAVRTALAAVRGAFADGDPALKWVPPANLHLTLKFLGETPARQAPAVVSAVRAALADRPSIACQLGTVGCFPALGRPRVLWADLSAGAAEVGAVQSAVERALADLGFAVEPRTFWPHITLARVKPTRHGGQLRERLSAARLAPVGFDVVDVALFSSRLQAGGPTYRVVERVALVAAPPGTDRGDPPILSRS